LNSNKPKLVIKWFSNVKIFKNFEILCTVDMFCLSSFRVTVILNLFPPRFPPKRWAFLKWTLFGSFFLIELSNLDYYKLLNPMWNQIFRGHSESRVYFTISYRFDINPDFILDIAKVQNKNIFTIGGPHYDTKRYDGRFVHECEDVSYIFRSKVGLLLPVYLVILRNWTFLNFINVEYLVSLMVNWQSDILSVLSRLW